MKIGIANDSRIAVEAIRRTLLEDQSNLKIAWVAKTGLEAVNNCIHATPDLVLMDLLMPVMDGVQAIKAIMSNRACPILIVSAYTDEERTKVFDGLDAGALDVVPMPSFGPQKTSKDGNILLSKIEEIRQLQNKSFGQASVVQMGLGLPTKKSKSFLSARKSPKDLIVIGASAGGPPALAAILRRLPKNFPAAVVIIQHIDAELTENLTQWLNEQSVLPVRLAQHGDTLSGGDVVVAKGNKLLTMTEDGTLAYVANRKQLTYAPSIDYFFNSVAAHWAKNVVGILLTGMGEDGAQGLKELRDRGYHTIAESEITCAVYGMPKRAAAIGAAAQILPLDKIAAAIQLHVS